MLFAISCFTHLEYNSKQASHKRLHIVVDLDVNLVLSMMLFYFYLHKKFVSPGHINWNPHIYIHNILRMHSFNTSFINCILLWNLYCFFYSFRFKNLSQTSNSCMCSVSLGQFNINCIKCIKIQKGQYN